MRCLVALLCFVALVAAAPDPSHKEWVTPLMVDDLTAYMASAPATEAPSLMEMEDALAANTFQAAPPMYYRPGFYPPVAPGYYGYFGYQPTYTHPYLSAMPRYMAVATSADPAPPASPPTSALAAYTQYGFPYSSFPPIPPPMPTYLPPPPYIPPDGLNAEGMGGAAAGAAPAAPAG